ncbi:MAG: bifunctional oligoribonuclease/PAP phosphatase NrnA [Acidobacteriota bacterium]
MVTNVAEELRRAFADAEQVLILSHDNPDPDALASAFALQTILQTLVGCAATVAYAGIIGRAENRAMLHELELAPVPLEKLAFDEFDGIAMVDTQPGFGNNSLPHGTTPWAVIDHHPSRGAIPGVRFLDIREGYGATSTMLAEYADACGVHLGQQLVTAIFYAIKSETQELGREASDADRRVYLRLFTTSDKEALARIQRARVPREYFRAFGLAIESAEVYGRTVVSDLRRVENPDFVAEIADFLLRLEGVDWACCMGRYGDLLVLSLRTTDAEAHAGKVIRSVVTGLGSAGGHGMSAGGRIPLGSESYAKVSAQVQDILLRALGCDRRPGEPLVIS